MRWLALIGIFPLLLNAQTQVTGRVVDASNNLPLAYCSVGVKGSPNGTITNEEGSFSLQVDLTADSITFSYVGFRTRTMVAQAVVERGIIVLARSVTELREVEIVPAGEALYELVARCAKAMRKQTSSKAKVYFEMNTHMDLQPVEVIECFYNASLNGPHIEDLLLKQGRIGIAPMKGRYFVSLDVTKAMSLLDIRGEASKFPMSPFQWTSARAIRKRYDAQQEAYSTDGTRLDHLLLRPRDGTSGAFSVDVWIDSTTAQARSIEMHCTGCRPHPFVVLKPEDRIEHMDMTVRFTFKANGTDAGKLDHTELSYALVYKDDRGTRDVRTTAVMHCFDHGGEFILPEFDYDQGQNDYRKITFQPYDSAFWADSPALVRTDAQERDRDYFAEHGVLTGSTHVNLQKATFFESNYAWWSASKRISLKTLPTPESAKTPTPTSRSSGATVSASQVHLEAQLYLDMDTINGTTRHFSATVFDGFKSFYRLVEEPHTDVFLNIFFDLCEMERRAMEERLVGVSDVARIRSIHAVAVANMQRTTTRYLKETRLGADRSGLKHWNDRVQQALGIDNFSLFGL